jgi:hypothetical protein
LFFLFNIVAGIILNTCLNFDQTAPVIMAMMCVGNAMKACSCLVEIVSLMICSQKFRTCALKLLT